MTVAVSLGILLAPTASSAAVASPSPYLLTLGDSYSIGYQPGIGGTSGYTGYLASALNLQAENFGCGGATTTSLLQSVGCGDPASQDGVSYPSTTQEQAALSFIAAHPGAVSLITVSIGGNDFDACSTAPCVQAAMPTMEQNVKTLMGALSSALIAASDTGAKIIGLTYPDVNLGLYVYPAVPPTAANVTSAQTSVTAFDDLINPTLSQSYLSVPQGSFVNVTSAPYGSATSGDDTPLSVTEQLAPYGTVPVAVGEICQLTYFCSQGNIHATTAGYTFIGRLALADYQALTSPPIITQQPVSHVVASGSSGTYTATASGVPTPTVQWQLSVNGGSTWTNIGGATSTTFVTAALSTAVNGWQLRAIFTNSAGTATSSAVVVTVSST
jgi:lysophospholipase L1-like esterase